MVQGGLLTVHPGSVHGGGEAPGGQSSLLQGAGKRSSGALDLGSAAAAEQRRDREKGFCPRGFRDTENKWAKGGNQEGHQGSRRPPPRRGRTLGRSRWAPGSLVVALWPHPGDSGRFPHAEFLSEF